MNELYVVLVVVLLFLHHFADFLLQAHQHGWLDPKSIPSGDPLLGKWVLLTEVYGVSKVRTIAQWKLRQGKKWAWYLDWIPHDEWHIVQTLRNNTIWVAMLMLAQTWPCGAAFAWFAAAVWYAAARACAFTVPMYLAKNKLW